MKRKLSGFTLIEIAVVIAVIAILVTISLITFNVVQDDARDDAMKSSVRIILSAQEKYFSANGEYLSSRSMIGAAASGATMTSAQYDTLAATLKVNGDVFNGSVKPFTPAVMAVGLLPITDNTRWYFMSKDTTDSSIYTFSIASSGCTISFPVDANAKTTGSTAHAMTFFSKRQNRWMFYASPHGGATISGSGTQPCVFETI